MITNYYSKETVNKLIEAGFYEWSDSQLKTYANEKRYTPDVDVLEDWLRDEKHIYISIYPAPDKHLGEKFNVIKGTGVKVCLQLITYTAQVTRWKR